LRCGILSGESCDRIITRHASICEHTSVRLIYAETFREQLAKTGGSNIYGLVLRGLRVADITEHDTRSSELATLYVRQKLLSFIVAGSGGLLK
jgi:hypothetical protein